MLIPFLAIAIGSAYLIDKHERKDKTNVGGFRDVSSRRLMLSHTR